MKAILILGLIMTYCKTVGHAVANEKRDQPNRNNVFVITLDGFRWQELFYGADSSLINDPVCTKDTATVKRFFWDNKPAERRKKLMPFFWSYINSEGQIFGNRNKGSKVNTSNIYALSYPGYNEMFTGTPDFFIYSNQRIKNKNISFLEYASQHPDLDGRIASFTSWDMFPYIFNTERSKIKVNSLSTLFSKAATALPNKNHLKNDASIRNDFATYTLVKDYILKKHPRLLHIGLSGTDTYGHEKKYADYLYQAHLADRIINWLWQLVQASNFYKNRTTFIITTDHGRGNSKSTWYKHGILVNGSSQTWMALLGNGVKKLGEWKQKSQLYQSQVAGTIGHFLNLTSFRNYSIPVNYFTALNK